MLDFKGFYSHPYRWLLQYPESLNETDLWGRLEALQQAVPPTEKHWEFVAIALLHTAGHVPGQALQPRLRTPLEQLHARMSEGHKAANWRLMRHLTGKALKGAALRVSDLAALGMPQQVDGFLPDAPDDRSTQYHAYNALLLARFADATDAAMRQVLQRALDWLLQAAQVDGDPNARGRGKFQLFGYAAMEAFAHLLMRDWKVPVPTAWLRDVRLRQEHYVGSGALPLWWNSPVQRHWLLGYNSCEDYPAFADFWCPDNAKNAWAAEAGLDKAPAERWTMAATEDGAQMVFSNLRGPVLALQPQVQAAAPTGVKSALRALLRAVTKRLRRGDHNTEPETRSVDLHQTQVGPWQLALQGDHLVARWALQGPVASAPVLWVRGDFAVRVHHDVSGSVDTQVLSWEAGDGTTSWEGLAVRAVRQGGVEVVFKLAGEEALA